MNDYFQHLIERSIDRSPVIRPRLPSRYESQGGRGGRECRISVRDDLPAAGSMEDAVASFPAQRDTSARQRLHEQGQAPIRIPLRELPENPEKNMPGRAASPLTAPVREIPELDEGADGLHPSTRPAYSHRRETAGFPEYSASVPSSKDPGSLPRNAVFRHAHLQKATSPDSEKTQKDPLPLPGENAHDPAAVTANYPYRTAGDPVHPDPMGRAEPQPEIKMPSSGAVAVQTPKHTVIRPLIERQPGYLMRERPELAMPNPALFEQTIRVTIGRIDVRAVMPRTLPETVQQKPAVPQPKVSLEEYLKKQWGGRQ
jgi:hypothetical protein